MISHSYKYIAIKFLTIIWNYGFTESIHYIVSICHWICSSTFLDNWMLLIVLFFATLELFYVMSLLKVYLVHVLTVLQSILQKSSSISHFKRYFRSRQIQIAQMSNLADNVLFFYWWPEITRTGPLYPVAFSRRWPNEATCLAMITTRRAI